MRRFLVRHLPDRRDGGGEVNSAEIWSWYNDGDITPDCLYWMLEVIRKDDYELDL